MKRTYLEVTYRKGRPIAAYFYLPRRDADRSVRTEKLAQGLLVDFSADGRAIGIEIPSPSRLKLSMLNRVLAQLGLEPAALEDIAPIAAA